MRFWPALTVTVKAEAEENPKQRQHLWQRETQQRGIGTKAQQKMKLWQEQAEPERRVSTREEKRAGVRAVCAAPGEEKAPGPLTGHSVSLGFPKGKRAAWRRAVRPIPAGEEGGERGNLFPRRDGAAARREKQCITLKSLTKSSWGCFFCVTRTSFSTYW